MIPASSIMAVDIAKSFCHLSGTSMSFGRPPPRSQLGLGIWSSRCMAARSRRRRSPSGRPLSLLHALSRSPRRGRSAGTSAPCPRASPSHQRFPRNPLNPVDRISRSSPITTHPTLVMRILAPLGDVLSEVYEALIPLAAHTASALMQGNHISVRDLICPFQQPQREHAEANCRGESDGLCHKHCDPAQRAKVAWKLKSPLSATITSGPRSPSARRLGRSGNAPCF